MGTSAAWPGLARNADRPQEGRAPWGVQNHALPGSQRLLWITEGGRGLATRVGMGRGVCWGAAPEAPLQDNDPDGKMQGSLASCA